ncbi:MAG: type pilus assembly protein PilM [Solirubrobacteraceae bacterium]|jgi:type IV pilus assembly protein PilM|nr:type pilus assembly protein PilM [Solirubrobacteraceae bacterium]
MAKRPSTLVGLEIEPSAVHAAAVSVNGRLVLEHAASAPLEAGVVRDGEVLDPEALTEALRALFRDNKDLGKRVRIGIANQKIVVRVIELPPISDAKELEAAVRFQAQDEIPMPLDSAVLDFQSLGVVETPEGPRQRVVLVAARRDMVEKVVRAAQAAGLRPEGIDLAAFAMVRALHRMGASGETVLFLAIGGVTNLAVAQGTECLFTRVVGGGLEALAIELAERRALTLEHARGWLDHVGLQLPTEEVEGYEKDGPIIEDARVVLVDGVRRIAGDVRNSVDFHHAQGGGAGIARCIVTGPAASLPGFTASLSAELGLPVEAGIVEGGGSDIDAARFTVAAGLAVAEGVA